MDESLKLLKVKIDLRDSLIMMETNLSTKQDSKQLSDKEYIRRMTELREETLINKGLMYFILPSIILGLFGAFFPSFYVILPVHETDICLCQFGTNPGPLFNTNDFNSFKIISIFSFLVFNWIFLTTLLIKVYRIRHIHD